jgi:hypothetical protein
MLSIAKNFGAIFVVLAGITLFPARGLAIEFNLSPTQVFTVWEGINQSLLDIARAISDDPAWHRELSEIRPRAVKGIRPADVLEQLSAYRAGMDRLRRRAGLTPIRRFGGDSKSVDPTVVYVNSGMVLNGQVEWLIRNTGPEQLVSQFYPEHGHAHSDEKSPNDVYAAVNLANRRLAVIIARAGVPDIGAATGTATP